MDKKKREVGLGRGLADLLDDNASLPNVRSNVLLRKENGECIKIYNKTGGEQKKPPSSIKITKR